MHDEHAVAKARQMHQCCAAVGGSPSLPIDASKFLVITVISVSFCYVPTGRHHSREPSPSRSGTSRPRWRRPKRSLGFKSYRRIFGATRRQLDRTKSRQLASRI